MTTHDDQPAGQRAAPDPTGGPAPHAPAGEADYDPTAPPPEDPAVGAEAAPADVEASGEDEEHHLTQGIRLVQSELSAALARTGIEGFSPKGERFDPVEHEAVAQQPFEGFEAGTIVEVLQPGYRLNDSVLRPARVIVAG